MDEALGASSALPVDAIEGPRKDIANRCNGALSDSGVSEDGVSVQTREMKADARRACSTGLMTVKGVERLAELEGLSFVMVRFLGEIRVPMRIQRKRTMDASRIDPIGRMGLS